MSKLLAISHMTVTGRVWYKCAICGMEQGGRATSIELQAINLTNAQLDTPGTASEMTHEINERVKLISNNNMPVGWAGYGLDVHKCEMCKS